MQRYWVIVNTVAFVVTVFVMVIAPSEYLGYALEIELKIFLAVAYATLAWATAKRSKETELAAFKFLAVLYFSTAVLLGHALYAKSLEYPDYSGETAAEFTGIIALYARSGVKTARFTRRGELSSLSCRL